MPISGASRRPLVSVIIPFRNGEAWLAQCCASVRAQTLVDWEALLIDDGSSDRSLELAVAEACRDPRFVVLQSSRTPEHTPGPWLPRNRGLEQARGQWVAFLDADDVWHPQKLAMQIALLNSEGGDLCVSAYVRFDAEDGLIRACRVPPAIIQSARLRGVNPIPMSTVVVRRSLLGSLRFRAVSHEDHDLWQRLFDQERVNYRRITQPLMAYRLHQHNLTQGLINRVAMKWQNLRETQQPMWRSARDASVQLLLYTIEAQRWRFCKTPVATAGFPMAGPSRRCAG